MNRIRTLARRVPVTALALAVSLTGSALFGVASSSAARRASTRTQGSRSSTPQQGTKPAPATTQQTQSSGGDDDVQPDNRIFNPRGRIAFASDRDSNFEIYVMNPDGSGQFRLTNDPGEDTQPTWSPDGAQIAFVSNRDGNDEIYVMSSDGANQRRLTNNPTADYAPAWSPDGTKLAFVSDQTGNDEIFTLDPAAASALIAPYPAAANLSNNPADDTDPAWSPNGAKLAFASNRDSTYEIYTMNADGSAQTRLTTSQNDDVHPAWTTSQITFQSERDDNEEVYVLTAATGAGQTNLTSNPASDLMPARSFDGARIIFASNRDGNLELYAANPAGANVTRLTNTDAADMQPAVQRLSVPANSAGKLFFATLDGGQETPPNNSTARGVGTLLLSADETTARVSLSFNGLSSPQTMAHIHQPAPPGVAGPVVFPLPLGSFSDFQITLTPTQVQQVKQGLAYFNVPTTTFPGGEIRGQINAAPQTTNDFAPPSNIYALTAGNRLLTFNSSQPNVMVNNVAITGLQAGEILRGIDIRPANGQLYGLGSTNRLYTINVQTGAATVVGTAPFSPGLNGSEFGFDFNPTVDRIRVVSDTGQNFRLNPDTGALAATDGNLAYAAADPNAAVSPRVSGAAYTNNAAGATTTTLYDIDYNLDVLVTQNPPNNGTLNTVGPLGFNTGKFVGFDIAGGSGTAFASLTAPDDSVSKLYTIDLTTGAATLLGNINTAELVRDIAVGAASFTGFAQGNFTVNEGAGSVALQVTRTGDLSGTATVDYDSNDGTASERRDYTTAAGVLRFAPGEATKTITVFITDDKYTEPDETFTVTLSNPVGAGFNALTTITGTIVDNDTGPPTPNPINGTPFFVRQHYIDFLNREPDQAGFNAFVSLLNNCSDRFNNPTCDRVAVSSSFARSPEFRLKAEFAIRFYTAAFNRLPTYREFIRDLSTLNGATAAEVMANLARFPVDFVEREEFHTIFDPLSNTAFVDRLIANSGVANAGRDQFIADLNAGVKTRAQVLREIVDNPAFAAAATNRAYILSQYFGYLRRDPDPGGFTNFLNFLNANQSNFREVTRSFVDSIEYRARFGTP